MKPTSSTIRRHVRAARRMLLRCEQARKDAIFLRSETFERLGRRSFALDDKFVFIRFSDLGSNHRLRLG